MSNEKIVESKEFPGYYRIDTTKETVKQKGDCFLSRLGEGLCEIESVGDKYHPGFEYYRPLPLPPDFHKKTEHNQRTGNYYAFDRTYTIEDDIFVGVLRVKNGIRVMSFKIDGSIGYFTNVRDTHSRIFNGHEIFKEIDKALEHFEEFDKKEKESRKVEIPVTKKQLAGLLPCTLSATQANVFLTEWAEKNNFKLKED